MFSVSLFFLLAYGQQKIGDVHAGPSCHLLVVDELAAARLLDFHLEACSGIRRECDDDLSAVAAYGRQGEVDPSAKLGVGPLGDYIAAMP
jgi:hypothetical protein